MGLFCDSRRAGAGVRLFENRLQEESFHRMDGSERGFVALVDQVHALEQLVQEDKRPDQDQASEEGPAPERPGVEFIAQIAGLEFVADAVRQLMVPDQRIDSERDGPEKEKHQQVIHGVLVVPRRGDGVDFHRNMGHDDKAVDPESDEGKQQEFDESAIGVEHGFRFLKG